MRCEWSRIFFLCSVQLSRVERAKISISPMPELDHFINISNFCCIVMKRYSLQQEQVNLCPKHFMRSTPGLKFVHEYQISLKMALSNKSPCYHNDIFNNVESLGLVALFSSALMRQILISH